MRLIGLLCISASLCLLGCEDQAATPTAATPDQPASPTIGQPTSGDSGTTDAGTTTSAGADYAITSENTTIGFVGGKPTGEKHEGGFKKVNGKFAFDAAKPESSMLEATIDMTSIWTDADGLTAHLSNQDFFEVNKYPEGTFKSTKIEKVEGDRYNIVGDLTMHGATKEITMPATIVEGADGLKVTIEFTLKRSEFGVSFGLGQVLDEVPVTVNVDAKKS